MQFQDRLGVTSKQTSTSAGSKLSSITLHYLKYSVLALNQASSFQPLIILANWFISDVWQGSEFTSERSYGQVYTAASSKHFNGSFLMNIIPSFISMTLPDISSFRNFICHKKQKVSISLICHVFWFHTRRRFSRFNGERKHKCYA